MSLVAVQLMTNYVVQLEIQQQTYHEAVHLKFQILNLGILPLTVLHALLFAKHVTGLLSRFKVNLSDHFSTEGPYTCRFETDMAFWILAVLK
jgi:hypothetical protein